MTSRAALLPLALLLASPQPACSRELETSSDRHARGEGFEVEVPAGFTIVTDGRLPVPPGSVALAGPKVDTTTASIVLVPVPDAPGQEFDPTDPSQCELVGRQMAEATKVVFEAAAIIEAPFGKTCEVKTREGVVLGRMVLAYREGRQVAITCRFRDGDPVTEKACEDVIGSVVLHARK